jgi:hypothetical protein
MSVILLTCGILLAIAGALAAGLGFTLSDLPISNPLMMGGAVAIVGGLQIMGLAAVVSELARIRRAQAVRSAMAAPAPMEPTLTTRNEPDSVANEPGATASIVAAAGVEVSASVIERMRSNIPRPERTMPSAEDVPPLSPNGNHSAPPRAEPALQPADGGGNGNGAVIETKEPRLDFLFRHRPAKQPAPTENFDSMWPKRPNPPRAETAGARREEPQAALVVHEEAIVARRDSLAVNAEPTQVVVPAPQEAVARVLEPSVPMPEPPRSAAILKSGVVDGMAYTLYADGSIEAQLPQGTVRFGSIAELRAHIENSA